MRAEPQLTDLLFPTPPSPQHLHWQWERTAQQLQCKPPAGWPLVRSDLCYPSSEKPVCREESTSLLCSLLYSLALHVTAAIHNTYIPEPTWVLDNRGTDEENVVFTHSGLSFSHKKRQSWAIGRKMHAEVITVNYAGLDR